MRKLLASNSSFELESLKKELVRAGIRTQVRAHSEARHIRARVIARELWVRNENDFINASRIYTAWRLRSTGPQRRTLGIPVNLDFADFVCDPV